MAKNIKTIVCLANSRKNHGRCIAGREWSDSGPGNWIRPVSDWEIQSLDEKARMCSDGSDPIPMDIIEVPLIGQQANQVQSENWLIDSDGEWKNCGRVEWDELQKMVAPVADLWGLGLSSRHGMNDMIDPAEKVNGTLRLVRVPGLQISVFEYWMKHGVHKRQVRARFMYNNQEYGLKVTDALYEKELKKMGDGEYELDECYVTISIVGPYDDGKRYGLVAAIIKQ